MAEDYQISDREAQQYLANQLDVTAEFLRKQGWKVTAYSLPPLDSGRRPWRRGYIIDDDCEKLIAWRLTYT